MAEQTEDEKEPRFDPLGLKQGLVITHTVSNFDLIKIAGVTFVSSLIILIIGNFIKK